MALTDKQEAFCQAKARGRNNNDSYRMAYEPSDTCKDHTVYNDAYKLTQKPEIAARIAELRKQLEEQELWTRIEAVLVLKSVIYDPESKKSEIVAASKELNSMHGFDAPTQINIGGVTGQPIETKQMPSDPIEAAKAYMDMVSGK